MGKRVLQWSDGRIALKAKVENVVLKKLSGKKNKTLFGKGSI